MIQEFRNNALKVCLVCSAFDPATVYGGPIVSNLNLATGLRAHGVDLMVLTTNAMKDRRSEVPVDKDVDHSGGFKVRYFHDTIVGRYSFSMMASIGRYLKDADIVHATDVFSFSFILAKIYSLRNGSTLFLSCRGMISDWGFQKKGILKKLWLKLFVMSWSEKTVLHATSAQEEQELKEYLPNIDVVVVPNSIEIPDKTGVQSDQSNKLLSDLGVTENTRLITGLGRLHKKKGFPLLISAFNEIYQSDENTRLLIAGQDYGELDELKYKVDELGIGHVVRISPQLNNIAKNEVLRHTHIFVMPSHHENFGNVYLEALSHGVPIVASTNTPWECVLASECGAWVDNTVEDIVRGIRMLMASDYNVISKNAIELAATFSVEKTSELMLKHYSEARREHFS